MSKAVNISKTTNVNSGDQVVPIASTITPAALGTAAIGTGTAFSRADHVHEAPIGGTSSTLITGMSGAAAIDTVLSETLQILDADNADVPTTTLVTQLTATGLTAGWWQADYDIHWGSSATTTGITFTISYSGTTQTFMATRTDPNSSNTSAATIGISSQATGAAGVTGQLPSIFTTNVNAGALGPNAGVTTANSIQYSTITALFFSRTLGDLQLQVKSEVAASAVRVKAGTTARYTFLSPVSVRAIFGYGYITTYVSLTNLVSNAGVVATDTTGVGTARIALAAAGYGTDKAIFGYGVTTGSIVSLTNLVSNTGVVAINTTGVGTARSDLAAAGYGTDKAIFGYGHDGTTAVSMTNLVSNLGVVATDTTGVGNARHQLAATGYGTDKAIFGYGVSTAVVSLTNLVSNTGVVSTDTTGVGTARIRLAATGYGTDKAIFGYGQSGGGLASMTNLVSNTGVVSTDTTGVGTARRGLAAAGYGTDKAIFGYGFSTVNVSLTNLISNTGVVSTDTTGVGTARQYLAAASFS